MAKITTEQAMQVMSTLMANIDWDQIDYEESGLEEVVTTGAERAGGEATVFLMNGASLLPLKAAKAVVHANASEQWSTPKPNPVSKPSILILVNPSIQLDAITEYDTHKFTSRPGLTVYDELFLQIRPSARLVRNLQPITLSSFELIKSIDAVKIIRDPRTPAQYKFETLQEFLAYFEQMISKQPNGEKGDLLADGSGNVFFVEDFNIGVYWDPEDGQQEWNVGKWELGDDTWPAKSLVFFPSPCET